RLDLVEAAALCGNFGGFAAVDFVAGGDGDFVEFVEDIELGDAEPLGAIDHVGVAEEREVEPAGAAGASGDGAEFVAALADGIAERVVELGGEWTFAN